MSRLQKPFERKEQRGRRVRDEFEAMLRKERKREESQQRERQQRERQQRERQDRAFTIINQRVMEWRFSQFFEKRSRRERRPALLGTVPDVDGNRVSTEVDDTSEHEVASIELEAKKVLVKEFARLLRQFFSECAPDDEALLAEGIECALYRVSRCASESELEAKKVLVKEFARLLRQFFSECAPDDEALLAEGIECALYRVSRCASGSELEAKKVLVKEFARLLRQSFSECAPDDEALLAEGIECDLYRVSRCASGSQEEEKLATSIVCKDLSLGFSGWSCALQQRLKWWRVHWKDTRLCVVCWTAAPGRNRGYDRRQRSLSPESSGISSRCNHDRQVCRKCLEADLKTCVEDSARMTSTGIACMFRDVCKSSTPISDLGGHLSDSDFDRLASFALSKAQETHPDVLCWCPNAECSMLLRSASWTSGHSVVPVPAETAHQTTEVTKISGGEWQCPACETDICARCKGMHHPEEPDCAMGRLDTKLQMLAGRQGWRQCPKCCMMVEKTAACDHISCRCGQEFCYACGDAYDFSHVCHKASWHIRTAAIDDDESNHESDFDEPEDQDVCVSDEMARLQDDALFNLLLLDPEAIQNVVFIGQEGKGKSLLGPFLDGNVANFLISDGEYPQYVSRDIAEFGESALREGKGGGSVQSVATYIVQSVAHLS
ncbi:hypothetical protein CYMTET_16683 [Cymbomonas tetramitiformis]|uniref:RBR-type E3 ubiquitin transferase n=1 Tax=Cymbomonas tetramitiformis TaxID=36881 RepID=A0AAE0GBL9_9CHLO|nr:hypothetical protein CYMTET_16683 [Cymbomonas tetramitiformis]